MIINILEWAGVFMLMGASFALGMYVTTQIGDWINRQIKK
tara:strand:+ start:411 stop:530 length:120 start_codon:yes stop_codon:yes gene_type:complete